MIALPRSFLYNVSADISDKFIRGLDLCNLLLEFQDIFSRGPHDLGGLHDLGDAPPVRQHPSRLPFAQG